MRQRLSNTWKFSKSQKFPIGTFTEILRFQHHALHKYVILLYEFNNNNIVYVTKPTVI